MPLLGSLLVLAIVIYGFRMIFGGPDSANRFARGVGRVAGNGVRHVGRASGRAANRTANRYPLAVGIIVLVVLAMLFFGNH